DRSSGRSRFRSSNPGLTKAEECLACIELVHEAVNVANGKLVKGHTPLNVSEGKEQFYRVGLVKGSMSSSYFGTGLFHRKLWIE
ncbi:hypothetical protein, partial [Erythrobacter sp. YJ-T3-07]|uniref:hypothetical protein n=1 Tax=Erythrobacter sp. YJ-T3-07 TaxID=2793063 RepID=UPI001F2F8873